MASPTTTESRGGPKSRVVPSAV
ncbi:MAG: hypothetical protein HW416_189, partial [Chloroflexi bacterium]|nr:hypothetical protein [Chloroflexota bacterium]